MYAKYLMRIFSLLNDPHEKRENYRVFMIEIVSERLKKMQRKTAFHISCRSRAEAFRRRLQSLVENCI